MFVSSKQGKMIEVHETRGFYDTEVPQTVDYDKLRALYKDYNAVTVYLTQVDRLLRGGAIQAAEQVEVPECLAKDVQSQEQPEVEPEQPDTSPTSNSESESSSETEQSTSPGDSIGYTATGTPPTSSSTTES